MTMLTATTANVVRTSAKSSMRRYNGCFGGSSMVGPCEREAAQSVGQASPQHHHHVVDATNTARCAGVHTAHVHVAALAHC